MNPTRSNIALDVTVSDGRATITAKHPAAEIRALSPAIAQAYAAFEAQNAAAGPLLADRQRARRELAALRAAKHPTREYDQTLDDELAREIANLDAAITSNGHAARRAAVDYLVAVLDNPRKDELRQDAAKLAAQAQEDAVAALEALEDALARREVFYRSSGRPAPHMHYEATIAQAIREGRLRMAHELLASEVADFPTAAVQEVADGGAN